MKNNWLILILFSLNSLSSFGQDAVIVDGYSDLVRSFFEYDRKEDLNVKEIKAEETDLYKKQKIGFDGIRNSRVPGYIATPKTTEGPFPCVVLFHSGIGSKDVWWEEGKFEHGKLLVDQLLAEGFAVLMLDAKDHGERTAGNDYGLNGAPTINVYRERMLQTTVEHRIALDYLETRADIDMSRIGAFGTSVGANMILALSTVDPRLKTMVVCSTIMHHENFNLQASAFDPIYAAPAHAEAKVLLQVGKKDGFSPETKVNSVYEHLNPSLKKLLFYDFGHRPKPEYIPDAVSWFKQYL